MKPFTHSFSAKRQHLVTILILTIMSLVFFSCGKSTQAKPQEITKLKAHQWYYFTHRGFYPVVLPQEAPEVAEKPWTEAVRISAAGNNISDNCALVNRLGILDFTSGRPELFRDVMLFDNVTADTLIFTKGGPVFHLYQNTHFNQQSNGYLSTTSTETEESFNRPLLVRYDRTQKLCTPVLSYGNMNLPLEAQLTSIIPQEDAWIGAVKIQKKDVVNFKYITFEALDKDGSIPDASRRIISTTDIDADTFRQAQRPIPLKEAPLLLQQLFAQVPESFEFYISCREEGKLAPVLYDNTKNQSPEGGYLAQGWGYLSPAGASALFPDGTVYITKSLLTEPNDQTEEGEASQQKNTGVPVSPSTSGVIAFRLPKLPEGFSYGEFTIHGNTLYAGWEETDFYKTARSGFISVDLAAIGKQL